MKILRDHALLRLFASVFDLRFRSDTSAVQLMSSLPIYNLLATYCSRESVEYLLPRHHYLPKRLLRWTPLTYHFTLLCARWNLINHLPSASALKLGQPESSSQSQAVPNVAVDTVPRFLVKAIDSKLVQLSFEHWIGEWTGRSHYHSVLHSVARLEPKGLFLPQFYGLSIQDQRPTADIVDTVYQSFQSSTAFPALKHIDTPQAQTLSRLLLNRSSLLAVRHARDKPPRPPSELYCTHCYRKESETVQHTLVRCPAYYTKRKNLFAKLQELRLRIDQIRSACSNSSAAYPSMSQFTDEDVQMHILLCAPYVYSRLSKSQLTEYFAHISDLLGYLQLVRDP